MGNRRKIINTVLIAAILFNVGVIQCFADDLMAKVPTKYTSIKNYVDLSAQIRLSREKLDPALSANEINNAKAYISQTLDILQGKTPKGVLGYLEEAVAQGGYADTLEQNALINAKTWVEEAILRLRQAQSAVNIDTLYLDAQAASIALEKAAEGYDKNFDGTISDDEAGIRQILEGNKKYDDLP